MTTNSDAALTSSDNPGDQGDKSNAALSKEVSKAASSSSADVLPKEATVGDEPAEKQKKSSKKKATVKSSVQEEPAPQPKSEVEVIASDQPLPAEPVPVELPVEPALPTEVPLAAPFQRKKSEPAPVSSPAPVSKSSIDYHVNEDMISREELNSYKITYDGLIQELQDRLSHEEDAAANLGQGKKKLEGDLAGLKREVEDLELSLQKVCTINMNTKVN